MKNTISIKYVIREAVRIIILPISIPIFLAVLFICVIMTLFEYITDEDMTMQEALGPNGCMLVPWIVLSSILPIWGERM